MKTVYLLIVLALLACSLRAQFPVAPGILNPTPASSASPAYVNSVSAASSGSGATTTAASFVGATCQ